MADKHWSFPVHSSGLMTFKFTANPEPLDLSRNVEFKIGQIESVNGNETSTDGNFKVYVEKLHVSSILE